MPANLAVCVGSEIDYVVVQDKKDNSIFLLAQARLQAYYKNDDDFKILKSLKGENLKGIQYEPIFDDYKSLINAFVIGYNKYYFFTFWIHYWNDWLANYYL